jgi:SAM-dependent methyltransferase
MQKNFKLNPEEIDFKLPCSDSMWQRFVEYKKRMLDKNTYSSSLYWQQREESFNVTYENGFVYLNGLYKRNTSKEASIGSIFQKLLVRLEIYYRGLLGKIFFKKSKPPLPSLKTKEDYIQKRQEVYDSKYKNIVTSILGDTYDKEHEEVYAKHMDIINSLEKNLDQNFRESFVEIGSGSGVLAFFLVKRLGFKKANLIDLPIMIPICFFWLSSVAGENSVALPGEKFSSKVTFRLWNAGDADNQEFSSDLAINITSFQEMSHKLVKDYFKLINRWLKPKGFFICVNRWNKTTDFWLYPYFLFKNFKTIIFDEDLTTRHSSMSKIIVRKLIQLQDSD